MKLIIRNSIIMLAALLGFAACQVDEDPKLLADEDITLPELNTPENTTYVLYEDAASLQPVTFSWSRGRFGFSAAGTYSVEVSDIQDFSVEDRIYTLGSVNNVFLPVTVSTLNTTARRFLTDSDEENASVTLYTRVKCALNALEGDGAVVYYSSNTVKIDVTTYVPTVADNPKVYIVGSLNGWDITKSDYYLECTTGDDIYVGLIELNEGQAMFRFYTTLGDWGSDGELPSIGAAANDGTNISFTEDFNKKDGNITLELTPGKGNIVIDVDANMAGTYTMTLNLKNYNLTIEKGGTDPSTWKYIYLIGSANGWDINGTTHPLICKNGDEVYTGTYTFPSGDNYFRFYTTLGDWGSDGELPSIGAAANDGTNVNITLTDGVYVGTAMPGKGCWVAEGDKTYSMKLDLNDYEFVIQEVTE